VQTCSKCNAVSPDQALECVNCRADLREFSTRLVALKSYQANPNVSAVRISVAYDSCPHCYELLNTYPKDRVPHLPHEGCSQDHGCRCTYEPVLIDTGVVGKVAS